VSNVTIRELRESELDVADHVFRLAFGTFIGLPDPLRFAEGANLVRGRWLADPESAFAAEASGELVGSNFATRWGSVGVFGPLTVHPDRQQQGIGKRLLEPVMDAFDRWRVSHAGLFTFAQSPKHIGLYQSFGFWPRFLTALMSKAVEGNVVQAAAARYSTLSPAAQDETRAACRSITDALYDGLDVSREILAVAAQGIGDTLLLHDDAGLAGFAVCHWGAGSEAETGKAYVKFGAARPGRGAGERFERLIAACECFAAENDVSSVEVGVNLAREDAYRRLIRRGYRTQRQGVTMHRPNDPGYSRANAYVIDDWR
jgi:GNAT superfamily N-acetyltransferase